MNKLSNEQKRLVQEHLHVIDWVLYKSIAVNETVQGMGREDLYQTGCLALCEAALSFDGRVRFQTYAQTFVRNALIDICRKAKTQRKYCCHYLEDSVPGTDLRYGETKAMTADAPESSRDSHRDVCAKIKFLQENRSLGMAWQQGSQAASYRDRAERD